MKPIPLLVELCAGTAALSLRLHEEGARPPVSRMGAKTGYADIILERMGLVPGQTADAYLWCEPDPGVRLLLLAYTDATLARAAADVIRGWAKEDPRALWERLKAEGPVRAPEPREVARWSIVTGNSVQKRPGVDPDWFTRPTGEGQKSTGAYAADLDALPELPARLMPDASEVDPRELARWARILTSNRLVNPDPVTWTNTGDGGYRFGGEFADPVERLAEGWDLPELPAKISPGAEAVDPREVARWTTIQGWGSTGYWCGPDRGGAIKGHPEGWTGSITLDGMTGRLDSLPELPATVLVEAVEPPRLPEGSWVYIDPPYQNTTGYAHDLPREEVVRLARLWREAGAHVCISEAEPIPDLVDEGWHVVEITADRKGQKRTFSKQKREFLTMSREPRGQLGFWGLS
ncbi:MAG: hypothetical protein ACO3N4_02635 [Ilumatobacteraceae bacterium]